MEAGKYFPANLALLVRARVGHRFNGGGEIFPRKYFRHQFVTEFHCASMEAGKYFPANIRRITSPEMTHRRFNGGGEIFPRKC